MITLLGQAVYPLWWPSLTKDMQTEQLLCWSGMTDAEHSTTSSSNEEDYSTGTVSFSVAIGLNEHFPNMFKLVPNNRMKYICGTSFTIWICFGRLIRYNKKNIFV